MNVEELVRDTLREQAQGQSPPAPGLADRVLAAGRRRRARRLASVAAATAAVVAVAVGVPLLVQGDGGARNAATANRSDQSPPHDEIAVGGVTLAAYYTVRTVQRQDGLGVAERTYHLLDPRSGTYKKDARWSFVAVAPGARTAAVLERKLPAGRIGLLDLATGEVERWIPVARGVGGVAFSPDGKELIATTYDREPDLRERVMNAKDHTKFVWGPMFGTSSRSGFSIIDVASGAASWSPVTTDRQHVNGREDFAFSRDGSAVYGRIVGPRDGMEQFYDRSGKKTDPPADEAHLRWDVGARLSPDGRLAALGLTAEAKDRSWSEIVDPVSGKEITRVRGAELLAWVDDRRLIAWERMPGPGAYRPRLVLVTIGSEQVVPLSGARVLTDKPDPKAWEPVFATAAR